MCQYSVETGDGIAAPWHHVHYGSLARGGAGAVIVEATGITPKAGSHRRIAPQALGLRSNDQRDALVPIVDFVHSQATAAGIQISHAGRKASTWPARRVDQDGSLPESEGGWQTVAPSSVAFPGLAEPREL